MLKWLAGGAAAATIVEPITRSIFLPPRGGWITFPLPTAAWGIDPAIEGYDKTVVWLQRELEAGMERIGPLYYDEAGIDRLMNAVHRVVWQRGLITEVTVNGREA